MSNPIPVTADEKRWEAESDARTLSEAQIIAGDDRRMSAAKIAADRLAEEERERAKALDNVPVFFNDAKLKKMFPNTPD